MKTLLAGVALSTLLAQAALAQNVGVSMAQFDDNFLTVLRQRHGGLRQDAWTASNLQVEDAQNDVAKQLDQIKNFVASGVDAIIVNPVDTSATQAMSDAAAGGEHPAGLRQPRADQRRHAARQPGLRRLERARVRHAGDQGGLPPVQGGGQDRGATSIVHHGRALEPGGAAAHRRTSTT